MSLTAVNKIPGNRDGDDEVEEHFRDENESDDDVEATPAPNATLMERTEINHSASIVALCLCSFTHSWQLVSIFPYSGFLAIKLIPGINEENAGSYAGLLAASFMIGRAFTSYGWGQIADVYGRRIVFFVSLVLSSVFSLLFGLSSSFRLAILWRFLQGASNGIGGISKTVVTEISQGNEKLETRGMSLTMGMWAWGFLLSPAISGFLSDPIRQYPDLSIWGQEKQHTPIYQFLESYPFFLPNLVSVLLCTINFIAVFFLIPETLPAENLRSAAKMPKDFSNWLTTLMTTCWTTRRTNNIGVDANRNSVTTDNNGEIMSDDSTISGEDTADTESESLLSTREIELPPAVQRSSKSTKLYKCFATTATTNIQEPPAVASLSYLWSKRDTRNHLIVFWIFSFVAIGIDEAFPLFCISKAGGLGLTESEIGKLLSATGLLFAIAQYSVYARIVDRYGIRRSIQVGALLSAPLVTFVPISILFNDTPSSDTDSSLTWASFLYLSLLLGFIRVFGLVFFSSITIATNRTVIPSHRATMNGLSMLGGSVAKALGPIAAGWLVSFGISSGMLAPRVGGAMVFVVIGVSSAITAWITFRLLVEPSNDQHTIHDANREREIDCRTNDIEIVGNHDHDSQQLLLKENIVHRQAKRSNII